MSLLRRKPPVALAAKELLFCLLPSAWGPFRAPMTITSVATQFLCHATPLSHVKEGISLYTYLLFYSLFMPLHSACTLWCCDLVNSGGARGIQVHFVQFGLSTLVFNQVGIVNHLWFLCFIQPKSPLNSLVLRGDSFGPLLGQFLDFWTGFWVFFDLEAITCLIW
jgi:hypothetical protein